MPLRAAAQEPPPTADATFEAPAISPGPLVASDDPEADATGSPPVPAADAGAPTPPPPPPPGSPPELAPPAAVTFPEPVPPAVPASPEPVDVTVRHRSEAERMRRSAEAVHIVETKAARRLTADLGEVLARTQGVAVQRGAAWAPTRASRSTASRTIRSASSSTASRSS